jgi:hypothetical protein
MFRSAKSVIATALFVAVPSFNASAAPVLFCKDGPGINLVTTGCISGESNAYPGGGDGIYSNAGGGDPESKVEQAILQATGVAVDISLYGASDANPSLFSFNPTPLTNNTSGTWTVLDGSLIQYITIKAANSFALFALSGTGAATGAFNTLGILNNGGQQPNVSHMRFWTSKVSEVPEPATGLLMLLGAGAALRGRRKKA